MKIIYGTTTELSKKWRIQSLIKGLIVNNTAIFHLSSFYSPLFIRFPSKGEMKTQSLEIIAGHVFP